MSHPQVSTDSPRKHPQHILYWLLAILDVVNASSKLAPHKASQKCLQDLVDTYSSEGVWEVIKRVSMTFGIGDALAVEELFRSHRNLPTLLKTEEAQTALSQWFERNSPMLGQLHQFFYGLCKLVPPDTTRKFSKSEASPEQRDILLRVSKILEGRTDNEQSSDLHSGI